MWSKSLLYFTHIVNGLLAHLVDVSYGWAYNAAPLSCTWIFTKLLWLVGQEYVKLHQNRPWSVQDITPPQAEEMRTDTVSVYPCGDPAYAFGFQPPLDLPHFAFNLNSYPSVYGHYALAWYVKMTALQRLLHQLPHSARSNPCSNPLVLHGCISQWSCFSDWTLTHTAINKIIIISVLVEFIIQIGRNIFSKYYITVNSL